MTLSYGKIEKWIGERQIIPIKVKICFIRFWWSREALAKLSIPPHMLVSDRIISNESYLLFIGQDVLLLFHINNCSTCFVQFFSRDPVLLEINYNIFNFLCTANFPADRFSALPIHQSPTNISSFLPTNYSNSLYFIRRWMILAPTNLQRTMAFRKKPLMPT